LDKVTLAEEISRWCGFPVGLNWWNVDGGTGEVKALHFEVDADFAEEDAHYLTGVYHAARVTGFPHGVKMRFLPTLKRCANPQAKMKTMAIRKAQADWEKGVIQEEWDEAKDIDHKSRALNNTSLRDYMVGIMFTPRPDTQLFIGVNLHWKDAKIIVSILPQVHEEAVSVLYGLLTHMRHFLNPSKPRAFDKLFIREAVQRADNTVWDVATGGVMSYQSQQLAMIDLEDSDLKHILEHADQQAQDFPLVNYTKGLTNFLAGVCSNGTSTVTHTGTGCPQG
jgi:hypothetical protein